MKSSLERVRTGATILGGVLVTAYCGYRVAGYDWIESLWLLTITISTVGYAESSSSSPGFQLFTIGVIVVGLFAAAYTFGGFVQMVLEGEIVKALGQRRRTHEIERLKGHVLVCGYGRIGQVLADDLAKQGRAFVVVEQDAELVAEAIERKKYLCLVGDATDEELLKTAGIERASALISALSNDAANVFITLTARDLNPDIYIVARAEYRTSERKLKQAGADRIVMPTIIGAHQMERLITRPHTADMLELLAESSVLDVEMDEVHVDAYEALIGKHLRDLASFRQHKLLVIAVKLMDGTMAFSPPSEHIFQRGEIAIVLGHVTDILNFRNKLLESAE